MSKAAGATRPVGIIAKTSRRIAAAATIAIAVGLLLKTHSTIPLSTLLLRGVIVGLSATTAFTFFEVWPRELPRWFQRWALQVVAVGVSMPVTTFMIYVLFTPRAAPPFWEESNRLTGLATLRERLRLIFGDAAHLRMTPNDPRGTVVEVEMPARP